MRPVFMKHEVSDLVRIDQLVTIYYLEFTKDYSFPGERHDFWEMVYVDKGEVTITADDQVFPLRQGELVFHRPNEFHKIASNGVTAPNVFVMSFSCASPVMDYFVRLHTILPLSLKPLITEIISEARKTFDVEKEARPNVLAGGCGGDAQHAFMGLKLLPYPILGGQQLIRSYLEILLVFLLREGQGCNLFPAKSRLHDQAADEIVSFLEANLYNKITISDLCSQLNYSKAYLCTAFKKASGSGIIQYYTALKIEEAKKLIRERNYNFSQIADLLQFNSSHYFSNTFKRITGMTPKEYAKSVFPQG